MRDSALFDTLGSLLRFSQALYLHFFHEFTTGFTTGFITSILAEFVAVRALCASSGISLRLLSEAHKQSWSRSP